MDRKKVLDFAERTTATFAQAFLGVALVTGISGWTAVEAAAVAGGIAAAKYAYVQVNQFLNKPSA